MQEQIVIIKGEMDVHVSLGAEACGNKPCRTVNEERLAAAIDKVKLCDRLQETALRLNARGVIKPEQKDRLIDFIKRYKHGVRDGKV